MDVFKTHGAFSWNELTTGDPERGVAFYVDLFGWNVEEHQMPGLVYRVVKTSDGTPVGGVMPTPADAPGTPPHWGSYVTVDSVDDTVAKVAGLGGSVLAPAMDIPGVGRMAVLRDPTDAAFAVIACAPT